MWESKVWIGNNSPCLAAYGDCISWFYDVVLLAVTFSSYISRNISCHKRQNYSSCHLGATLTRQCFNFRAEPESLIFRTAKGVYLGASVYDFA